MSAAAISITKLPPGPERKDLHYDRHIQVHLQYPASAETGIAMTDYARMSTHSSGTYRERRLETPEWATNDEKLRALTVAYLEARAGFRKPQPGTEAERLERAQAVISAKRPQLIEILDRLSAEYVALKRQATLTPEERKRVQKLRELIENVDTTLIINENVAAKVVGVVGAYYRRGLDSVAVGAELSMKPPAVRMMLWRLHRVWEKMHEQAYKPTFGPPLLLSDAMLARAIQLNEEGKTCKDIAKLFGVDKGRVEFAFRRAGHVPHLTRQRGQRRLVTMMLKYGVPMAQISRETGVPIPEVKAIQAAR